ncbi:MAG: 23S rRNA (adenine(2030)-N(6))-methyltransferase RlmJ [Gammaproteobacteria bacterium]
MNYRHLFHAGNFADIFKHTLLLILLDALNQKPAPWCYFDSHAGAGLYDLTSREAQRGGEAATGMSRLWRARSNAPAAVAQLCTAIARVNPGLASNAAPRFYPGSPLLAAGIARSHDRLVLADTQNDEARLLRVHLRHTPQAAVHARDGYEMLKALTPPAERRGLALIDPPFEQSTEFVQMRECLKAVLQRWPAGIYALWYPRKDEPAARRFERAVSGLSVHRALLAEFYMRPPDTPGFNACGMALINPPWQSEHSMESALRFLRDALAPESGGYRLRWLQTERA